MKATLGSLPSDDERWAYEVKYDGYRTLAFIDGGGARLQSTKQLDVTATYPELAELPGSVHAATAILDGELAVLDDRGRPRFELMQRHDRQAVYFVFDVLRVDEHDTIALPYEDRRRLLSQLVEPGANWQVPAHRVGGGPELLAATGEQELEGIMAKRLGSTYVPGKRSSNWRKVKHRRRIDVVVGGVTEGSGNRTSTFGSLLVGRWDGDRLVFAGGVGSGFGQALLESLTPRLRSLGTEACPFDPVPPASYRRTAWWVEPVLTATIEMTELTNDGLVRQASLVEIHDPAAP
jgi:bifunctional non-homologous end joining protein LigD